MFSFFAPFIFSSFRLTLSICYLVMVSIFRSFYCWKGSPNVVLSQLFVMTTGKSRRKEEKALTFFKFYEAQLFSRQYWNYENEDKYFQLKYTCSNISSVLNFNCIAIHRTNIFSRLLIVWINWLLHGLLETVCELSVVSSLCPQNESGGGFLLYFLHL